MSLDPIGNTNLNRRMIFIDEEKALKIFLIELIEMTIRLDLFLEYSFEYLEESESNELKSYYGDIIESVKNEINDILSLYCKAKSPLKKETIKRLFNKIDLVLININLIHINIIFLKGKDIRPETYLFIKDMRQCFKINDFFNLHVFPNECYNYEWIIEDINKVIEGEINVEPSTSYLYIPKIETEAPLMWSQLAHELAHANKQVPSILEKINKTLEGEVEGVDQQRLLVKWGNQIVSDILALRLLGIGYFVSFLNFSIRTSNLITKTADDPSVEIRIGLMADLLIKDKDVHFEIKKIIQHCTDLVDYYSKWSRDSYRSREHKIRPDLEEPQRKKIIDAIDNIIDKNIPAKIAKLADKQMNGFLVKKFNFKEYEKLEYLSEKLKEGIIISSYRVEKDSDIRDAVKKFESKQKDDVYKDVIEKMAEMPNNILEIINGAWLYRIINHLDNFEVCFLKDNPTDFSECYNEFKVYIKKYDDILLKSIENSQLHQIFGV